METTLTKKVSELWDKYHFTDGLSPIEIMDKEAFTKAISELAPTPAVSLDGLREDDETYLEQQFNKLFKQWEQQKETIRNYQKVYEKHFDGELDYHDSETLDEKITNLKQSLSPLSTEKKVVEVDKLTDEHFLYICNAMDWGREKGVVKWNDDYKIKWVKLFFKSRDTINAIHNFGEVMCLLNILNELGYSTLPISDNKEGKELREVLIPKYSKESTCFASYPVVEKELSQITDFGEVERSYENYRYNHPQVTFIEYIKQHYTILINR